MIRNKMYVPALEYMRNMFEEDIFGCSNDFDTFFTNEFDCFSEVLDIPTEQVFTFLKNAAFSEEKEIRVVYNTGIYKEIDTADLKEKLIKTILIGKNKELIINPIQHQVKNNKLVAYADMEFKNCVADGIVQEIMIGPKSKASKEDVRQLLLVNGFEDNILIDKSTVSYR